MHFNIPLKVVTVSLAVYVVVETSLETEASNGENVIIAKLTDEYV